MRRRLDRVWHIIENSELDISDATSRIREHRERQEKLEIAAEVVDIWGVWRSGQPAAYGLPMMLRELPDHIRLDNGPESTARAVREWVDSVGARTMYIEPRSRWGHGYIESFGGKMRDELMDREIFYIHGEPQL